MIKERFLRIICNNLLLLSFVTQAAVLALEHYRRNALPAKEVSILMQLAAHAVLISMIPLILNVEYATILVLRVVPAQRKTVSLVNQDLP